VYANLGYIQAQANQGYDAGMDVLAACRTISFADNFWWDKRAGIAAGLTQTDQRIAVDPSPNRVVAEDELTAHICGGRRV